MARINKLVFATKNKNKLAEVSEILKDTDVSICGVEEDFDSEAGAESRKTALQAGGF